MGDRREQNATSVLGVIYGQDKSVEKQERKKVDGMSTDTYFVPDTSTIKNHRLRAKLTQDECARLVCVTQATWARWEKGQCRIPAGLWKLFIIETKYTHEANEANDKIPKTTLQTLTDSWDDVLDNVKI
tara:strand:+ start:967 stop:1353 length:387 start_codon:yes stop_codon:yes gene_type:complete